MTLTYKKGFLPMIKIDKVGESFSVEYFRVNGDIHSYTDDSLMSECSGDISYGRVFRKGRRLADVEIYQYEMEEC